MRCLVTGGAGFIGSNLSKKIMELGWCLDIVDDFSNGHIELIQPLRLKLKSPQVTKNFGNLFIGDFSNDDVIENVKNQKYDVVFHQAAIPRVSYSVEFPAKTNDVNVKRTVDIMEACIGNVKRFIFASSSSVYGGSEVLPTPTTEPHNPKSPYALQKCIIENYCTMFSSLYNLDTLCLRYFNVFGPGQFGDSPYSTAVSAWCHAISKNLSLRSDGDGTQSRDMCYVDNVVSANILSAKSTDSFCGNAYNVCCGDRTSNNEILSFLKNRFSDIKIESAQWRPGDVMHTKGDISKSIKDLNYAPDVRFWDGLERTLEWWNLKK